MVSLISIVMPTLNSARYVDAAIASVLRQTFSKWELLIVDGGSSDDTIARVLSYDDERIKIFNVTKMGVPAALNYGFDQASGDLLCWLNSDDVFFYDSVLSNVASYGDLHDFIYGDCSTIMS